MNIEDIGDLHYLLLTFISVCSAVIGTIIFSNIFQENNYPLFIWNLLILFNMYFIDNTKKISFYLITGFVGAITEGYITYCSLHSWQYKHPDFINVPIWLFPLWSIVSAFIYSVGKYLLQI